MYTDDELLMISGIQHYAFCPTQWCLIHIEQEWAENRLTAEGKILHKNVDDPTKGYKRDDVVKIYAMPIVSYTLGLCGIADCIELSPLQDSSIKPFIHPRYPGTWVANPVEFKHGKPKNNNADRLQLMAQATCIEEIYGISINQGSIYYGKTKHREEVELGKELRTELNEVVQEMHLIMKKKKLITGSYAPKCKSCSLMNLCMPTLSQKGNVREYLRKNIWEYKL